MRHPYGSCHFEDCPACERIADMAKDAREHPSASEQEYGDNQAQDRYERQMDREWA